MSYVDPREIYARVMATPEYAVARDEAEAAQRDILVAQERLRVATAKVTVIYDDIVKQLQQEGRDL